MGFYVYRTDSRTVKGEKEMTVKEMIIELLNCPMDAKIVIEIPTQEDYKYSSSENIENIIMIDDERCLIR